MDGSQRAAGRSQPAATEAGYSSLPDDLVGYRLRRVHSAFVEAWRAFFAAEGLAITPVGGGILMSIAGTPGLTQTELARRLEIETPTLHEQIKRLVQADLVVRAARPGDRRATALSLTAAGVEVVTLIQRRIGAQEAEALAPLTAAERRLLGELLGRVLSAKRG
ncbi:MAG: MarR family winged helix-turn-helix transcriptional regulator [Hyphomicrobiaceae bacterium]